MTFPTIQFKATNVQIDQSWRKLVDQKFASLEKHIGSQSDVSCNIEFEKMVAHQTGDIHRLEANVYANGKLFRAEATAQSFEVAIDMVRKELERELTKAHEKRDTLLKRGRRKIKDMLRFGR